ncbi:MAG: hypothetical protein EHM65_11820, partial [Acidobacteriales bacterium]
MATGQLAVETLSANVNETKEKEHIGDQPRTGLSFARYFTSRLKAGETPYDQVAWELRTAMIANDKGTVLFEQRDVEVPADWSQTATNIVASKYFHGKT